jgi:hypothetical protein
MAVLAISALAGQRPIWVRRGGSELLHAGADDGFGGVARPCDLAGLAGEEEEALAAPTVSGYVLAHCAVWL